MGLSYNFNGAFNSVTLKNLLNDQNKYAGTNGSIHLPNTDIGNNSTVSKQFDPTTHAPETLDLSSVPEEKTTEIKPSMDNRDSVSLNSSSKTSEMDSSISDATSNSPRGDLSGNANDPTDSRTDTHKNGTSFSFDQDKTKTIGEKKTKTDVSSTSASNTGFNQSTTAATNGSSSDFDSSKIEVSLNPNTMDNSVVDDKNPKTISVTTMDQNGNPIVVEMTLSEYSKMLQSYGLIDQDIQRILSGNIDLASLMQEIDEETDQTRRRRIMEAAYLQAMGLDFTRLDDMSKEVLELEKQVNKLEEERSKKGNIVIDQSDMMEIVKLFRFGYSYEEILNSYVGFDTENTVGERFKDSEFLKGLKEVLNKSPEEQEKYLQDAVNNFEGTNQNIRTEEEDLDSQITAAYRKIAVYNQIKTQIENEIDYRLNYLDYYPRQEDFVQKSGMSEDFLSVRDILQQNSKDSFFDYIQATDDYGMTNPTLNIDDKETLIKILGCQINHIGNMENGTIELEGITYQLTSKDELLSHFPSWLPFLTDQERQIFNYLYNTGDIEEVYNYVQQLSDQLDNRWLAEKKKDDTEWAQENWLNGTLASIGSIIVTPFEGINAVCCSMNSYFTGNKIRRMDVYSSGDVWRSAVASELAEYNETLAFLYSTGMSMADSTVLIGLNVATGGTIAPVLSATVMGSRSYVSTLNDALDRGLNDGSAIALAWTSAVVETAMENYSLGHLANLETNLGKRVTALTSKVAAVVPNQKLGSILSKGFYVLASAISQGLAEGEEEFATEILNYVADEMISGDLRGHAVAVANYVLAGMSEEEAHAKVNAEFQSQLFQAFLGGFVSGCCFGSFSAVRTTKTTSKAISQGIINDYNGNQARAFANAIELMENDPESFANIKEQVKANKKKAKMQETLHMRDSIQQLLSDQFQLAQVEEKLSTIEAQTEMASSESNSIVDTFSVSVPPIQNVIDAIAADDFNKFLNSLNQILDFSGDMVIEGYSSLGEYKRSLVKQILDSGALDQVENKNRYVGTLSFDSTLLSSFIGTDYLNDLYVKNLIGGLTKKLVHSLSELSETDFNNIFSAPALTEYINSLNGESLGNLLKEFKQTDTTSLVWLSSDVFLNKIENFEVNEFYDFIHSFCKGYSASEQLKAYSKSLQNSDKCISFFNTILQKFYTTDVLLDDFTRKETMVSFLPSTYGIENVELKNVIQAFGKVNNKAIAKISEILTKNSTPDINLSDGKIPFKIDGNGIYCNLEIEVDGVSQTLPVKQFGGVIDLSSTSLYTDPSYVQGILAGTVVLKKVENDFRKNALIFTEEQGIQKGLNEIVLLVDGIEHTVIAKAVTTEIDLNLTNYDIDTFLASDSVQLKSIKALGNLDVDVEQNEIYSVKYKVDGQLYETFMRPIASYTGQLKLPINQYVQKNNLVGFSDVVVEALSQDSIKSKILTIDQFKASKDIFQNQSENYGGNQSDVSDLLNAFVNQKLQSQIDISKAELLNQLIDKYLPNLTNPNDRIKLSEKYATSGCSYMAVANAFATYMGTVENGTELFKSKIGYDLICTDGVRISYNLEAIAFDLYLSDAIKKHGQNIQGILDDKSVGPNYYTFEDIFRPYFEDHGINLQIDTSSIYNSSAQVKQAYLKDLLNNKNGFAILNAVNFDLKQQNMMENTMKESLDGALANSSQEGDLVKDISGHAMLVTGITDNLELEVSSWSKKYTFLSDSIQNRKDANCYIRILSFDILSNTVDAKVMSKLSNAHVEHDISSQTTNTVVNSSSPFEHLQNTSNNILGHFSLNDSLRDTVSYVQQVIDVMNQKNRIDPGSYSPGFSVLEHYIKTGDSRLITRDSGCRDYISSIPRENLVRAFSIIQAKNGSNIPATTVAYVQQAIDIMNQKNRIDPGSYSPGFSVLEHYIKTGDSRSITRDSDCRSYIECLPRETLIQIVNKLKTNLEQSQSIEEINKNTQTPIKSYRNLGKMERAVNLAFEQGGDVYGNLVSVNTSTPKAVPSDDHIRRYYNRFLSGQASGKYNVIEQPGGSFCHFMTSGYNTKDVTRRLYLNNSNLTDTLVFTDLFATKCEERSIPFYFKIAQMKYGASQIHPSELIRDENIVIYASDQYFADYVSICKEIKGETSMEFLSPPILTGVIDGFMGYGTENRNQSVSYNQVRSGLVSIAVECANNDLLNQYDGKLSDILSYIRQNEETYRQYLQSIYNYIYQYSNKYCVDFNTFFLNKYD